MNEDALRAGDLIERIKHAEKKSRVRTILISVIVAAIFVGVAFQGVLKKAYLAYTSGIPFNSYDYSVAQLEMSHNNLECLAAPYNWIRQPNGSAIDVKVCRSGDILIRYHRADGTMLFRWVAANSLARNNFEQPSL
jgi:hypothetical protein